MSNQKLTVEQFVQKAFETLRQPGRPGLHTVFSGFNEAFRAYFPGLDPVEETKKLVEEGKIVIRLARRGAVIYPKDEAPPESSGADAPLKKMGLQAQ